MTHSIFFTSRHSEDGWITDSDHTSNGSTSEVGLIKIEDLRQDTGFDFGGKSLHDFDVQGQDSLRSVSSFYAWLLCNRNPLDTLSKICALDPRISFMSALEYTGQKIIFRHGQLFGSDGLLYRSIITQARFLSNVSKDKSRFLYVINRKNKALSDYLQDVIGVQTRLDDGVDRLEFQMSDPKEVHFKTYNPYLESHLTPLFQPITFSRAMNDVENARHIVRTQLDNANLQLTDVAELMHVSPRTLQRRLRSEGSSFSKILDTERLRELELQSNAGRTLADIAETIGLQDVRSVYRLRQRSGSKDV